VSKTSLVSCKLQGGTLKKTEKVILGFRKVPPRILRIRRPFAAHFFLVSPLPRLLRREVEKDFHGHHKKDTVARVVLWVQPAVTTRNRKRQKNEIKTK